MKRMMALIVAATLAAPLGAYAVGAVAVDDMLGDRPTEVGYFIAAGKRTAEQAKQAALHGCREQGYKHCRIGVWYATCGAYASSLLTNAYGVGKSREAASHAALKACGKTCEIIAAECESL